MSKGSSVCGWDTIPLRYVCTLNPPVNFDELQDDDEVTFLPMEKVKAGFFIPHVEPLASNAASYNSFAEGDILLAKVTPCFENGNIAIAENLVSGRGYGSSELFVLRPKRVLRKFLFYALQSPFFKQEGEASMTGAGGLKRVSPELLRQYRICLPRESTQQAIADYLDRETARIDALIAAKERLLGLLAEKRQALITRAVTRGLDPNAPLRYSNIPWLGPIPAHWELSRLKFIAQVTVGIVVTPAKYYQDGGVPCLRSLNVKPNRLSGEDLVFISEDSNEFHAKSRLRVGDVVVVRTGVPGTAAVVDQRFDGANCIDLILIRPSPNIEPSFLSYFLNSEAAKRQFLSGSDGAAQQHFNVETATNLQVILPPIDEQSQIIADMGERLAALEKVASSATHTITLLKERRSALIAAAVTGQIPIPEPDPIP